jgi:S-adenosylmethionine:tRNA ribosyltransferase-isomerase
MESLRKPEQLLIDEYDYALPDSAVAVCPVEERDSARLLIYNGGNITDSIFSNLHTQIPGGFTVVLNNTRVIEARLKFSKATGGSIEIFCLRPAASQSEEQALAATGTVQWRCFVGGAAKWKPSEPLYKNVTIGNDIVILKAEYIERERDSIGIEFSWPGEYAFAEILGAAGAIPLPPYIKRGAEDFDKERYQTVFANRKGSVAAPTAALHFTDYVFSSFKTKQINSAYITLHVGAGTFKPVQTPVIADHVMHAESFFITDELVKNLIEAPALIAVGTTSLRTLESLYWIAIKLRNGREELSLSQWEAYEISDHNLSFTNCMIGLHKYMLKTGKATLQCNTSLLIIPGYRFRSAEGLITNFHQPRSTLLLLIAAFVGDDWKKIYNHALEHNYRFLSYGDSSLLWKKGS